jgi:hypothetical protein
VWQSFKEVCVGMSAETGGSRPSKNNRQEGAHRAEPPESDSPAEQPAKLEPADLPGATGHRPLSVEEGVTLREEGVFEAEEGYRARHWWQGVNMFRQWYADYQSMHIEFEGPDGETSRSRLENSYQPQYGKRYYARLKDLERGIERQYENLTTVMLTFSASHLNANGEPRCPADHMREIAEGWSTARKQVYQALDGYEWEYARVWEPHEGGERSPGGYGHLHVAIFVEADDLDPGVFKAVLESYTENVTAAGSKAHTVENAVSVNDDVENLGSYISEYIGIFGDEVLDRPIYQQMFYAVSWLTNTRRLDFSNGAQEIIKGEEFRRETGLKPEHRGEAGGESKPAESNAERRQPEGGEGPEDQAVLKLDSDEPDDGEGWQFGSICKVVENEPDYFEPATGEVVTVPILGRDGMDPPREVD